MKDSTFYKNHTINCGGKLLDLSTVKLMGIVNLTPDSFYDGGKIKNDKDLLLQCEKYLNEGATILDFGAQSTKPNALKISLEEEIQRIENKIQLVIKRFPDAILSVDTYYSKVAKTAVDNGAHIVNDISAGSLDNKMIPTMLNLNVPYIASHILGTPSTMQDNPTYENVTTEVYNALSKVKTELFSKGFKDLIIDPGFGFGKSMEHNYELLNNLDHLKSLHLPVLVGISRKSMIWKKLKNSPDEALNGTTVLNTIAVIKGANILRVHDVKEAKECIDLVYSMNS